MYSTYQLHGNYTLLAFFQEAISLVSVASLAKTFFPPWYHYSIVAPMNDLILTLHLNFDLVRYMYCCPYTCTILRAVIGHWKS